jgi:UDP-2,4-diacetamido-2,4,6-trideoxy-beta-L-altropyranose hydrolase
LTTLLFRADADARIGAGHVMRCLALAQGWQDRGGSALLATAAPHQAVARRVGEEGVELRPLAAEAGSAGDAERTVRLARESGAAWVVVDGYHFDAVYQRRLEEAGLKVLWIDDEAHAEPYVADLVLNQNPHAEPRLYARRERRTRLLLGPRFALLRREFRRWRRRERRIPERARRILVTLGGGDPHNVSAKILRALGDAGDRGWAVRVVLGGLEADPDEVRAAAGSSRIPVELLRDVHDMAPLMAEADLAVAAAGSTTWELLYMGLPAILLVLAPNQAPIAREVTRRGAALGLGRHREVTAVADAAAELAGSPEVRARMSRIGRSWIDGRGVERVLDAIERTEVEAHAHSLPGE